MKVSINNSSNSLGLGQHLDIRIMPSSLITGLLPKKARKGLINSQGDANKKASRKQKETLAAVSLRRSRICDVRGAHFHHEARSRKTSLPISTGG